MSLWIWKPSALIWCSRNVFSSSKCVQRHRITCTFSPYYWYQNGIQCNEQTRNPSKRSPTDIVCATWSTNVKIPWQNSTNKWCLIARSRFSVMNWMWGQGLRAYELGFMDTADILKQTQLEFMRYVYLCTWCKCCGKCIHIFKALT